MHVINGYLKIVDDDCVIVDEDDEDDDASVKEKSQSSRPSRRKRQREVSELEKFGDDVDSEENNQYNCDDDSHLMRYEDLEFTQLREEYEESLTNPSYQQTNSSSNTNVQLTVVPVPTRSQSQVPTRFQSQITVQSQISNTPSTQLTQYRNTTPSSYESHRFSNPPSAIQGNFEPNYTP